jgi:hypothetical protein
MGIFSASGDYAHGSKKKLNGYNFGMIMFVSIGSLCYGYTVRPSTIPKSRLADH